MKTLLELQKSSPDSIEIEQDILNLIFKNLHSAFYITAPDGDLLFITNSVEEMLGYSHDIIMIPGFWQTLVHPEDVYVVRSFLKNLKLTEDFITSVRLRKADGEYLLIQNTGTVRKEKGEVKYVTGNLHFNRQTDIFSKSKDNSHYYYAQLLDSMGLAFYSLDNDLRITSFNKSFADWMFAKTGISYTIGDPILYQGADTDIAARYQTMFKAVLKGQFVEESLLLAGEKVQISMTPVFINERIEGAAVLHFNKAKESKLANSILRLNKKVENIINSTADLFYELDTEFRFLSFNKAYETEYIEMYGEAPKIGQKNPSIDNLESYHYNLPALYQQALNGEATETEINTHKNVSYIVSIRPIFNKEKIVGLNAFYRNISDIRLSEQNLIKSEERFKYVVDHVTDVVFQTDASGNWTFLNRAWKTIMEFEVEDSIDQPFYNYLHPDDVEKNQLLFEPLITRKKEYCSHEIRYITRSGNIKWMKVFATLLINDDNIITGTTGTLKDVTSEKENSYRYELLANNASDQICLQEIDGTFLYLSPSYTEFTGYQPHELIGRNITDYIHPEDLPAMGVQFAEMEKNGDNGITMTYRFCIQNGRYVWYESKLTVIFDEFYGRKLIIASSRNIEKRKQAEQQMLAAFTAEKQLNELKSRFVTMASHEFRTPMTSIKSGAEIAELYLQKFDNPDIKRARDFIKNIDHETDRLTVLINNILLLSRIESDSLRLNKTDIDLNTLLESIISRQNNLQEDGRVVMFTCSESPKPVVLDALHLTHIIDNLLSNAFKYSVGSKNPELHLLYEETGFEIQIKDYGIGIPQEDQAQVFNTFFRAKNTEMIQGTGIGLVLVQNFVSMHGGSIRFESKENEGTLFIVNMPYTEQ